MQKEVILSRLAAIEKELKKRREGERNIAQYNKTKKHAKQLAFHRCKKRNRWVFGGNRSGKTECGAVECLWILRGIHPYRKNRKDTFGWAVSLSTQVQRDVAQAKILKYLPKSWISEIVMLSGRRDSPSSGVIDQIKIKNVFGGISTLGFKSCDQGREKFQGSSLDFVWFDEEPPKDNITENTDGFTGVTSATGLQLILEQDEERMEFSCQQIKRALRDIGRQILRLYRQFAADVRLLKFTDASDALSITYFKGSDVSTDDVFLATDSEANLSPAQRRTYVYELIDRGLLSDSDGRLSVSAKNKILELLDFKALSCGRDISELNRMRAGNENVKMRTAETDVKAYEEHRTHIEEHTAFLLSESVNEETEKRICAHIDRHKKFLKENDNG